MEKSRTKNSIRNAKSAIIMQLINKIMAFIVRTVFIRILNTEYLGVNGLFSNILTMLSLAELGIGTAIIFNMYKPIAEEDSEKIKSLLQLYKKAYFIIGTIIFVLGLLVIPFLKFLIKETPNIVESISIIYLLFLVNTSISYFFTYKKSIISAHQQESTINNILSICYLLKSIAEIIFLIITHNYIIYLIIQIIFTMIQNIVLSLKANKMFPYIKEKNIKPLNKTEKRTIFKNVKSLIVYKIGSVILSGTDNILISTMINVATVGLCSNYTLIITSVKSVINSVQNSWLSSIGNLNTIKDVKKKENVYYELNFLYFWVYGFCAIAFIFLLNPFIKIWLGNDYLLGLDISIALSISFFIEGLRYAGYSFRTTLGLFQKGQFAPYIATLVNIVSSIILCMYFGTVGIFIGTSIAQLSSYTWIDPYLLHKYEFKTSLKRFFKKYIEYFGAFLLSLFIILSLSNIMSIGGIAEVLIKGLAVTIICNLIFLLLFRNSDEFKSIRNRFIHALKTRKKDYSKES